jgi:hypothetical protein
MISIPNDCQSAVQALAEAGFDGLASALELLLNEVMLIERSEFLGASPYERTPGRRGHANGFKDKTLHTRVGDLQLKVPQARQSDFYPQVLAARKNRPPIRPFADAHAATAPNALPSSCRDLAHRRRLHLTSLARKPAMLASQ